MRRWFQYLSEERIDICCAVETHLDKKRERTFRKIFETEYHCVINNRKNRKKADSGSGGVAILVKKTRGKEIKIIPIQKKGSDEVVWTEVTGMGKSLFLAAVYLVPKKSRLYSDNEIVRKELEVDILKFKELGTVIVMGHMNSRIGTRVTDSEIIQVGERENPDKEVNDNGKAWISLMKRTGMVTLTGLYGKIGYTCIRPNGNSVVDHICIDSRSRYLIKKLYTKEDVMSRIDTDHCMVVAEVKIVGALPSGGEDNDRELKVKKSKRKKLALNRITEKEVWKNFREKCDQSKAISKAIIQMIKTQSEDGGQGPLTETRKEKKVEKIWRDFIELMSVMEKWATKIAEEHDCLQFEFLDKSIKSNQGVTRLLKEKFVAWERWKMSEEGEEKQIARKIFNNCKNRVNKARKRLRENHKRNIVKEIENLKSSQPGIYWRKLKELSAGRKKKRSGVGKSALDENGTEVFGEEIKRVFKLAFEKLGKEEEIRERFDEHHKAKTIKEVQELEKKNKTRGAGELSREITLDEVTRCISKLKKGKAAGIDEIINELIKYGGEQVHMVIWQLLNICFKT